VESSGGANPLKIAGVSKFGSGSFVEHVRERINEVSVTKILLPRDSGGG
jgi:hypothetical protein